MKQIIKWTIGLIIIGFVGYFGWMAYQNGGVTKITESTTSTVQVVKLAASTIETTVSATGSVRTNQSAQVSWQTTGKVGTINVQLGDQVKANAILARLDPASLPTDILMAKSDLAAAQAALSALTSSQTPLYQAEKDVIDAQTAVNQAQNHRDMMNSDTRGTELQIVQAEANYARAQANVNRLRQIYESLPGDPATEFHDKAPALLNLEKAKTARNSALATLNWYAAKWSASDIIAADKALAVARAALIDAQTALAKIQSGSDTSKLDAAKLRILNDEAIIDAQFVNAPISGTVTSVNAMVGDIVSPNTVSFRIDDTSAYFVDLAVSEVDVASVKTGQTATITFDAIDGKTYQGVVTQIGSVGANSNSVVNFTVTIQITDADSAIKPGMTAAANIVTASAENVLVVPSRAIKTAGSQMVVYLVSGAITNTVQSQNASSTFTLTMGDQTALTPVSVTVGLSSDNGVQITSNRLKTGDLIAVNPSADLLAGVTKTTPN